MTRGTGYLITDTHMYFHDEFNGDMYRYGHGEDFILMLDKATPESFGKDLQEWNANNHSYKRFNTYKKSLINTDFLDHIKVGTNIVINFNVDYFKWWFSDWIFVKNSSSKDLHIITRTRYEDVVGKTVIIKPNETYAFSFGYAVNADDVYTAEDVKKKSYNKKKEEVKE